MIVLGIIQIEIFFLSCNSPVKEVKNDQENINRENKDTDEINSEYLKDIQHYRDETAKKIELNTNNIAAFKANIDTQKGSYKYDYRHSIFELELYNSYMQKNWMITNQKEKRTGKFLKKNLYGRWMSWMTNLHILHW